MNGRAACLCYVVCRLIAEVAEFGRSACGMTATTLITLFMSSLSLPFPHPSAGAFYSLCISQPLFGRSSNTPSTPLPSAGTRDNPRPRLSTPTSLRNWNRGVLAWGCSHQLLRNFYTPLVISLSLTHAWARSLPRPASNLSMEHIDPYKPEYHAEAWGTVDWRLPRARTCKQAAD